MADFNVASTPNTVVVGTSNVFAATNGNVGVGGKNFLLNAGPNGINAGVKFGNFSFQFNGLFGGKDKLNKSFEYDESRFRLTTTKFALTLTALAAYKEPGGDLKASKVEETPLAARPTQPYEATTTYDNRPLITVKTLEGDKVQQKFDSFFLHGVQENDAEKYEVVETFGTPHIFVSGRFARKYTFSGIVRVYPVNEVGPSPVFKVSQNVMFREFYEKYLRASEQARNGWITEILVDKEVYTGYVSTFNYSRDANVEGTIPFVFSFTGTKRGHVDQTPALADAAMSEAKRKEFYSNPTSRTDVEIERLLNAIDQTVSKHRDSTLSPATVVVKATPSGTDFSPELQFNSGSSNNLVSVSSSLPGIGLFLANNIPLSNAVLGFGPVSIFPKITDYWALHRAVNKLHGSRTSLAIARFTIRTSGGQKVPLTVQVGLTPPTTGVVTQTSITVGGVTNISTTAVATTILPELKNSLAYTGATITATIKTYVTAPSGIELDLSGAILSFSSAFTKPAIGSGLYSITNIGDTTLALSTVETGSTVVNTDEGWVSNTLTFTLPYSTGAASNPFTTADRLVLNFTPVITLANGNVVASQPLYKLPIRQGTSASNSVLRRLALKEVVYESKNILYDNGKHANQLGYLTFVLTTAEELSADVLRLIKQNGTFILTPASGFINPIPLSSSSVSSGEISRHAVHARTLSFTKATATTYEIKIQIAGNSLAVWEGASNSTQARLLISNTIGLQAPPICVIK